jgi:hypothetical protein
MWFPTCRRNFSPSSLRINGSGLTYLRTSLNIANPSGRAVGDVGLRSLPFWDYGFESRRGHRCLSLVSVVSCTDRGLWVGEESYRVCVCVCVCVCECDCGASIMRRAWHKRAVELVWKIKIQSAYSFQGTELDIQSLKFRNYIVWLTDLYPLFSRGCLLSILFYRLFFHKQEWDGRGM